MAYENLTLWTPQDKRVLLRDLTLELPYGKRLLISGPRDCGKSALCLATAGLWGKGRGKIRCPKVGQVIFLPQRLYTATGRLRDLLFYGLERGQIDDEQLRDTLRDVGLDYLAEQRDGLDTEWDWPNDLSIGDQHALALARLLLAKPRFAFLDGAPWGLAPARVEHLYAALVRTPTSYITIGAPGDLLPHHDLWLELHGDGGWRLRRPNEVEEDSDDGQSGGTPLHSAVQRG